MLCLIVLVQIGLEYVNVLLLTPDGSPGRPSLAIRRLTVIQWRINYAVGDVYKNIIF